MKKFRLTIIIIALVTLAIFGAANNQVVLFFGFLFLSGMILGANHMSKLLEMGDAKKYIKRKNIQLAILGSIFGILSITGIAVVDLLMSFACGMCFGLIGVNLMFERS